MKAKDFYKSRAWYYCSKCVLLHHAKKTSEGLLVQCVTSGRWYKPNDRLIHAGHFIKVFDGNNSHFSTAFEFENILPQSYADNKYFSGKPDVMSRRIEEIFGEGTVEKLLIKSKNVTKLDKFTLDLWKDHYKKMFNELVSLKGNPWK